MLFGILSGVTDVITLAKFSFNRLSGFFVAAPPKCHFLYFFERRLQQFCTTVQTVMGKSGSRNPNIGSQATPHLQVGKGLRDLILKFWDSCISHAGTVVPECFKDDNASHWRSGKFGPRSLRNPWTDRHKNLHGWLRRGPLPLRKISSRYNYPPSPPKYTEMRIKWLG